MELGSLYIGLRRFYEVYFGRVEGLELHPRLSLRLAWKAAARSSRKDGGDGHKCESRRRLELVCILV
jgi:hypothetical protein